MDGIEFGWYNVRMIYLKVKVINIVFKVRNFVYMNIGCFFFGLFIRKVNIYDKRKGFKVQDWQWYIFIVRLWF